MSVALLVLMATGCLQRDEGFTGNPAGPTVTIMGDSITLMAKADYHTAFEGDMQVRVSGWSGFTFPMFDTQEAPVLERDRPTVAVIDLGTNDVVQPDTEAATSAAMDSMYRRFTSSCVVGVTVNEHIVAVPGLPVLDMAEAARINTRIRSMADEVADWSAAAAGHPEYFGDDARLIHPDATGRSVLIPLVRDAIDRCFRQLNRPS